MKTISRVNLSAPIPRYRCGNRREK